MSLASVLLKPDVQQSSTIDLLELPPAHVFITDRGARKGIEQDEGVDLGIVMPVPDTGGDLGGCGISPVVVG